MAYFKSFEFQSSRISEEELYTLGGKLGFNMAFESENNILFSVNRLYFM